MTVFELMSKLGAAGIKLWLEDGQLKFKAPKGALTPALKDSLVAKKQEVIDFLSATRVGADASEDSIPLADRTKSLPLSFSQQRMWFIEQLMPANSTFHIPSALYLNGLLDRDALQSAFENLIARHESLRTIFTTEGDEPVQIIQDAGAFDLTFLDFTEKDPKQRELETRALAEQEIQRPFDLSKGPLIRAKLIKLDDTRHGLIVVMHHIVSDGWSMDIFVKEIAALYGAARKGEQSPLEALSIQYADYAHWQRNWLKGDLLDAQVGYWKKQLANAPELLALPYDRKRPAIKSSNGSIIDIKFEGAVLTKLRELARELDVTLYVLLLAAYKIVLSKWSGQTDVCVGMPVAGRTHGQVEPLIGFFVNTLVIRSQQENNPSIREFVAQIREQVLSAQAHQDVPLEAIVEALNVPRNLAFSPLYQVAFSLSSSKAIDQNQVVGGLEIQPMPVDLVAARLDLTLMLLDKGDAVTGVIEYNTDLFDRKTVELFSQHYKHVLDTFVNHAELPVFCVELETRDALPNLLNTASDIEAVMPLTPLQRDFVLDSVHDRSTTRNTVGYISELPFEVDHQRWLAAINQVAAQRPNQRIVFFESMSPWLEPVYQGIRRSVELTLECVDLQDVPEVDVSDEASIAAWARKTVLVSWDVLGGELSKHWLVKVSDGRYLGLSTWHHAITDGSSEFLRMKDALAIYFGQPTSIQSVESYEQWVNQRRAISDSAGMLDFWHQQLQNVESLGLRSRQPGELVVKELQLSGSKKESLQAWSKAEGVSFVNLLRTTFALAIRKCYYDVEDIALIEAVAGRNENDLENAGCYFEFTPSLFKGADCESDMSVVSLLNEHRGWRKQLNDNVHLSFSARSKVLSREGPEFQFNYRPPEASQGFEVEGNRCYVSAVQPDNPGTVKLLISPEEDVITLRLSYYSNEFDGFALCDRMASVLDQVVSNSKAVNQLEWLLPEETKKQLESWQGELQPIHPETVLQQFKSLLSGSSALGDKIAVKCQDQTLTYSELDALSNQFAHWLLGKQIVKGDRVAIALDRSVELPAYILGALKAGAVYVPIDPSYPADRIAYIVGDCNAKILITEQCVVDRLAGDKVDLGSVGTALRAELTEALRTMPTNCADVEVFGNDSIYVIYTSGSTGKPKGAEVYHLGEVNLLNWYSDAVDLSSDDNFLLISAIGFDLTQKNFFAPLVAGATLTLLPDGEYDPEIIADCIAKENISIVNCAPSAFYPIAALTGHSGYPFPSLTHVVLGGEPIRSDSLMQWLNHVDCNSALTNSYGPTECTDVVASWQVSKLLAEEKLPIGEAIPNCDLYVVDKKGELMPTGAIGELCVGGVSVGAGYLNNPELNATVFESNPYHNGRWYHTGDLARLDKDGVLYYVGRKDFQVKLRGLRIEPGEIDALIKAESGVEDSLTLVRNDLLISYVVAAKTIDLQKIKQALVQQLPGFMVPSAIVELAAWPLTPNGKVDRKALPEPDLSAADQDFVAPRNSSEKAIAEIWCQVLKLPQVGVKSDFFSIGGHSLLATQVISRIRQTFGVELSVRALFEGPTIEQLLHSITTASDAGYIDTAPAMVKSNPPNRDVLSFAQYRLWFIDQLNQGSSEYNMPAAMRIGGPLNIAVMDRAFGEIIKRHEVLRTNFTAQDGIPQLVVQDPSRWSSEVVDLTQHANKDDSIKAWVDQDAARVFDLANDLLISTTLLKLADEDHVLLINMHHIVSDGWSIGILIQELSALYKAFSEDAPSPLPELPIQYSDFAVWQRNWLQGDVLEEMKAYWVEALDGAPEVLRLPTDFPRPKQQTFNGAHHSLALGDELTAKIYAFCDEHDYTPFMLLMGAYQLMLSRYCSQQDICVGIPIAGRNRTEIEGLIGFFINGLVIRTKLDGNPDVLSYLKRVKNAALGAYAHQDMPADVLADALKLSRSAEHAPGAQVGFALQNTPIESIGASLGDLQLTPVLREHKTAKYEFSLILQENNDDIGGVVEYNTDLFTSETVAKMMRHFRHVLESMVAAPQTFIDHLELVSQQELYEVLDVDPEHYELYPLSPMQRDMYLDILVEPDSLKNSMGYHGITDGEFDLDAWTKGAQKIVDDQPLLRCRFIASDLPYTDVAYHLVEKKKSISIEYIDLSDQNLTDQEAADIAEKWVWRPYNATQEDLADYRAYKLSNGRHMLCFRMNHMVADGVGMGLHAFNNASFADAFKAGTEPRSMPPLFFEHVKTNRLRMDQPDTLAHWKEVGKTVEALDFSLPPQSLEAAKTPARVEKRLRVNDELWEKIKAYSKSQGVHPSLYFKVIYGMLINVYCRGENDFYISEVLGGRSGMHKMTFGNYFQVMPVVFPQALFSESSEVSELFRYINGYKKHLKKKCDISLLAQRQLLPQSRLAFMFNYYNFIPTIRLHGTLMTSRAYPQVQDGPIQFVVHEQDGWMELVLVYLSNLFADLRFLERVEHISEQIVSGVERISDIEFVLPDEREKQLVHWIGESKPAAKTETVLEAIVSQVALTPDAIAVKHGEATLSYQELDTRSNGLAQHLLDIGVKRGECIGICLDRSVEMLTSVLAVMKAGATYVPMDSNYPSERLNHMLQDSRAPVLITQQCVKTRLEEEGIRLSAGHVVVVDENEQQWLGAGEFNLPLPKGEDLIYIIYTSGSTGVPKGAAVRHSGESNLIQWYCESLDLRSSDKCLLVSAFGFDLTQKNLFAALTRGGCIVIPDMDHYDVEAIAKVIDNEKITIVNCAPSAFYPIVETTDIQGYPFSSLRYLVLGGEPIRLPALQNWLEQDATHCKLMNSYGPTECTDVVASHVMGEIPESGILPIGKPIPNTQLYVTTEDGRLVPEGVVGELCIAGSGVGAGYLRNSELTAAAFKPNSFGDGQWYRSGDLVRYWPDGNLEYVGRKDFQVKLRGLRIEMGEIEAALRKQPGVLDSLTLVDDERLISYVVAEKGFDESQVRNQLRSYLPDYMLPAQIVPLETWPLTPNGKVDRKALPSPDAKTGAEFVAPRNETEQKLASIWSDVLGVEKVGIYDNFFDLGGHSLLAARAVSKFRHEFDVEIPLRALFELHTVADIAEYLDTLLWAAKSADQSNVSDPDENRDEGFL